MAEPRVGPTRRSVVGVGAALMGGAGVGVLGYQLGSARSAAPGAADRAGTTGPPWAGQVEPFHGPYQAGVRTPPQAHATFLALDLRPGAGRDGLRRLLRQWTEDATRLTRGVAALADPQPDLAGPPARLTITVGLGDGALEQAGLTASAPAWLAPLPAFGVDRLEARWSDGDIVAQVCAEDPIVVAHAARTLLLDARGIAELRWQQRGFRRPATSTTSMRNLMGQVDGTVQPTDAQAPGLLWIADEGPAWLRGGTSLVLRRIRMNLDTWDQLDPEAKEQVIGRRLSTGAPLTGSAENDIADLGATKDGLPVIASFAHIRHAAATPGSREQILRRPYNYDEPPTGSATADAGLLFAAYARDPLAQFVPLQRRLDQHDLLNVWTTPIGSSVVAVLPGCREGEYLGQALLD